MGGPRYNQDNYNNNNNNNYNNNSNYNRNSNYQKGGGRDWDRNNQNQYYNQSDGRQGNYQQNYDSRQYDYQNQNNRQQRPQGSNGGRQQGYQSNSGRGNPGDRYSGHQPSDNRFQALSGSDRPDDGQQSRVDPKEQIPRDLREEKPKWILSSYGHSKDVPRNDLVGDVSFEEVRWRQYQERAAGVADFKIRGDWQSALEKKEKEFKALLEVVRRGGKPPSLGGGAIVEPNPWTASFTGLPTGGRSNVVFGQRSSVPPPPATPSPALLFGNQMGAPVSSGAPAPSAWPAPSATSHSTFSFGAPPAQQPQAAPMLFGQPVAPLVTPQPFPPSPAPFATPAPAFAFSQPQPMTSNPFSAPAPSSLPLPALFQETPTNGAVAAQSSQGTAASDFEIYRQPRFSRGQIPDKAPPMELCA